MFFPIDIRNTHHAIRYTKYNMFIIDGHNLLHAIFKSEEDSGVIRDVGLCRSLGRYFTLTGEKATIQGF